MMRMTAGTAPEEAFVLGHAACQAGWEARQRCKMIAFPCPALGGKLVPKL